MAEAKILVAEFNGPFHRLAFDLTVRDKTYNVWVCAHLSEKPTVYACLAGEDYLKRVSDLRIASGTKTMIRRRAREIFSECKETALAVAQLIERRAA